MLVAAGNSGLGSGLLDRLLDDDQYDLVATFRNDPRGLHEKFAERGLDPDRCVIRADLTKYDEVVAAVDHARAGGPLWGIVNLAGTSSGRRLVKTDPDDLRTILLDNALPSMYLTRAGIIALQDNGLGGGRLIHLSSVTVRRPVPGVVPYVAGKAAVEGVVRSSAEEAGRSGITVNALRLGYFEAGMTTGVPASILDGVVASTAARRLGGLADLAAAVRHLLSTDASFVTGAVLDLDGGLT